MIDIHCHIAWGLDDGATSVEESLSMLRAASQDGITDIVATPHCSASYQFDPTLLRQRTEELAGRGDGRTAIHLGCEFRLDSDNIEALLESPSTYTINGAQYLLLEFPDHHLGGHTEAILKQLIEAAIVPIVAHPERNSVLQQSLDRVESWIDMGCLIQVTARSIMGGFGGASRSAALHLLDSGLVHIVATDAHDARYRHPALSAACQLVRRRSGEEVAELLFIDHPGCIIRGCALPEGKPMPARRTKRRWWQFGLGPAVDLTKASGYPH
jgi:protein-tyrosine phosphatase